MASRVTITIQTVNPTTNEDENFNIGYVNPALLTESDRGAAKIDACARAIVSMSENTYIDTLLVTTESVANLIDS